MEELFYFNLDRFSIKKTRKNSIGLLVFMIVTLMALLFIEPLNFLMYRNSIFVVFLLIMFLVNIILSIYTIRNLSYSLKLKYFFKEDRVIGVSPSKEYEYLYSELTDIQISLQTIKNKIFKTHEATFYKFNHENLKEVKHLASSYMGDTIFIIYRFNNETLPMDDDVVDIRKTIEPNYFILEYRDELLPFIQQHIDTPFTP